MARTKQKGAERPKTMKARLPPPAAKRNGKGEGQGLMFMAPRETLRALKIRAAEQGTTTRALVLEALRKAGYPVPTDELTDRRR